MIASLSSALRHLLIKAQQYLLFHLGVRTRDKLQVVVGAHDTKLKNWLSTDQFFFDITKENSWKKNFGKKKVDKLLAEHVFEHLTIEEIQQTLFLAHKYLKKGGTLRIAVPDGYHPSRYVIDLVKPFGLDEGSDDHKVLLNIDVMRNLGSSAGFEIVPLEYFDKNGLFHKNSYSDESGKISRSKDNYRGRFTQNKNEYDKFLKSIPEKLRSQFIEGKFTYTSLIVDLRNS